MTEFTLNRMESTPDGVLGRMGKFHTLEEEDLGNARNISCIPPGRYICKRTIYNKAKRRGKPLTEEFGYETFEVTGVPGRSCILFHPGNTEEDTAGCILLGLSRTALRVKDEDTKKFTRKLAVASSRLAFKQFMAQLEGADEFVLRVRKLYREPAQA